MTPQDPTALVAYLGIQLQLAGSLLCLGLGLALRRDAGPRPWFTSWVWSFGAIAVAVGALFARYFLVPVSALAALPEVEALTVYLLYAVYLAARVAFFWLLVQGAWRFARAAPPPRWLRITAVLAAALVLLPLALEPSVDLSPLMVTQAAVATLTFAGCSLLLHRMPAHRITRGSRALRLVFLAFTGLWLLYVPAFLQASELLGPFFSRLTNHNSYIDTLFQFFLCFGILLTLLDEVARERLEERSARLREVAASESRLNQIVRSAAEGIVLLDGARRVAALNPAALEILECGASEAVGQPFDRFLSPPDRVSLWAGFAASSVRPGPLSQLARLEAAGIRAGGEGFPMEVSLAPLGEDPGHVMILRDLTESVRLRKERELMQTQLAQGARMETIGRMISGVAHELNNPLAAILAFAQDLLAQARTPEDREALTTIVQQAQRCRSIVQDLVTFARSRREEREPISPAELVARVRPAFERQAGAQGARLVVELGPGLPLLEANPAALEQVLTNLLSNAFQALDGPGEVLLRAVVAGARVNLEVEDTGHGIPADVLPRVFEPFFTTKPPGQGTGLGLSVSQSIVEQHGGSMRALPRRDGAAGARFVVGLPFIDRRTIKRPSPPVGELQPPALTSRPRRVLVVDDEAPIRVAIRRFLERRGWIVDEARDGQEALDLLELTVTGSDARGARYDAIVTDLRMPGMTGIALHDRLAADAPEVLAKLVVISGDTASPEVADFLLRLRRPLVQKPFDLRTLAELLDEAAPPADMTPAVQPP